MATVNLWDLINHQSAKLPAPLVLSEADGEVTVVSMSTTALELGTYEITVSFVTQFTSANNRLAWRVTGTNPSPTFLKESKDALENLPFAYTFTEENFSGVFTMNLLASLVGGGVPDATIQVANLLIKRIA